MIVIHRDYSYLQDAFSRRKKKYIANQQLKARALSSWLFINVTVASMLAQFHEGK